MDIITSFDNSKAKLISALGEKKYRDSLAMYIAEGLRWIVDAAVISFDLIELVVVRQSDYEAHKKSISNLVDKTVIFADKLFDKLTLVKNSQGILAVIKTKKQKDLPNADFSLFLDRIRDPGNMGTIIRTACASGYNEIICNDCVDIYNPKVIRSSMSAILNVNIFHGGYDMLDIKRSQNVNIFAADMHGSNVFELENKPQKLCLIIGGEADGISTQALERADKIISIPMLNVESLNAAVSASILMYFFKQF